MGNSHGREVDLSDNVTLNHFRLLRVVGKGAFGKVRIVERKDSGLTFALKYIRKEEVVRSESVKNIIRERNMLQHLNHPFLCNLRYTFQDLEYMYIVQDLMSGGDLRFHISRKTFTEEAVRFWIAELGCALRYIHQQRIIHRDIKPDNVLLDAQGHVHLGDFNVATTIVPGKPCSSRSGTLAYLAPEVYAGRGYYAECDWWSLGVLFYECIYNKRPFVANNQDDLAALIIRADPPFPNTAPAVSNPCLHAISSLLEKNKKLRIGAAGFETFTDNPFFREIDFDALERKEIEPIFIPSSEKTNFDATYDLEELLLEEAPLEARARKQKPRPELRADATPQEIQADKWHRYIEVYFTDFNYTKLPQERSPADPTSQYSGSTPGHHTPQPTPINNKSIPQEDLLPLSGIADEVALFRAAADKAGGDAIGHPRLPSDKSHEKVQSALKRLQTKPRSQTTAGSAPGTGAIHSTWSSTYSPNGSPPLLPTPLGDALAAASPRVTPNSVHGDREHSPSNLKLTQSRTTHFNLGATEAASTNSSHTPRPRALGRSASTGGGGNLEAGMNNNTISGDESRRGDKPTGMLGFLNRKKGRDRSPKPRDRERGVLGKDGARIILKD